MNLASLALGFAFIAIGLPFVAKARKESDPAQRRNKSLAGYLFVAAGAIFLLSFAISAVNR
ncbi:MAG TPA: hypothetical protein VFK50_07870 [Sphingomicrobium sp.]|nr:hypothetical protein [Sphingomicrobium sp.]